MKKHAYSQLPEGYSERFSIDLQKNKKLAVLVNGLSLLIAVVMVAVMHPFHSILSAFEVETAMDALVRLGVLGVGMIAYLVLHEAVHGIAMKCFGTKKVRFGFTGLYAFAGSSDWYDKMSYLTIALAPVVFWGIVLLIVNILVPEEWFWTVYLIQVINMSGAAGDLYVTCRLLPASKDILIRDAGVSMTVYSAAAE